MNMKELNSELFGRIIFGFRRNESNEPCVVTLKPEGHGGGGGCYYSCMRHPEVHRDSPGNCPSCNLPLVQVCSQVLDLRKLIPQEPANSIVEMDFFGKTILSVEHIEGVNDRVTLTYAIAGLPSPTYYTCMQHPNVHQNKPGFCPYCHSPLVPVSDNLL